MSRAFASVGRSGPRVGFFMPIREAAGALGLVAIVCLPIAALVIVLNWLINSIITPRDESATLPAHGSASDREYREAVALPRLRSTSDQYWERVAGVKSASRG
jgi:hypothetical protein